MKCFIIFLAIFVASIAAEAIEVQPNDVLEASLLQGKKPEKRGIGYNGFGGGVGGYTTGLGYDAGYNGIGNGLAYNTGLSGYNAGYNGYPAGYNGNNVVGLSGYNNYNPLASRVAGLGGGFTGYSGYNGYSSNVAGAYNNGAYNNGYYNPAAYSRTTIPYQRGYSANYPGNYNNYPNYYSGSVYPNTYNGAGAVGGLGVAVSSVPSTGYSYGPGVSGGIY